MAGAKRAIPFQIFKGLLEFRHKQKGILAMASLCSGCNIGTKAIIFVVTRAIKLLRAATGRGTLVSCKHPGAN